MPIGRCRLRTGRRLHSGHRRLHSAQRPQGTAPAGFAAGFTARLPSGTATDTRAPRCGRAGAALRGRFCPAAPFALSRFDARRDSLRCCHCKVCARAGAGFDSRGRARASDGEYIYVAWACCVCGVRFSPSCSVVWCNIPTQQLRLHHAQNYPQTGRCQARYAAPGPRPCPCCHFCLHPPPCAARVCRGWRRGTLRVPPPRARPCLQRRVYI